MKNIKKFAWEKILDLKGDITQTFHAYEQWQWLDEEQTHALQQRRLATLLLHAYQHVPYYRQVLAKAGVADDTGRISLENFARIPLLDKSIIRGNYENLKSDDLSARKWIENTSGGSTGEPVRLVQDDYFNNVVVAIKLLFDQWSGCEIGGKKALLWGSERDLFVGRETLRTHIGRWLRSEMCLNALRMTYEQMHEFVARINAFRPVQILAYASSIYELSRFVEREGLQVYSPQAVMTSAGTLYPHMRETIGRVLKSPVFNRYGSREVGDVASECDSHKGLHVSALTHYVEILRPDGTEAGPGEMGEITITLLSNYAMPLVRYRIEDIGGWAEKGCACGRSWPLLKEIAGKVTDIFITKSGIRVDGGYFEMLFYPHDWVERYQVIQEDYEHVRVVIVPRARVSNPQEHYMREVRTISEKICFVMGRDCRIDFEYVDTIAPTPSGKYRFTLSKVAPDATRP